MAELEAIREARRQRILQSSEDRINRVLGKGRLPNELSGPEDNVEKTGSDIPNSVGGNETDPTQNVQSFDIRQRNTLNGGNNHETVAPKSIGTDRPVKNTVKISPIKKRQTAGDDTNINESLNTSGSSSDAKMMLKHFEFLRIVLCFIVAFLCRKVLAHGYGVFYIQSVIIPFACLEAGFFTFKHKLLHNVMLPHRSSMLITLLMLCGIRADVLHMYNKAMGYLTAAGEDFAMFFFAFMMSNLFVS